MGVPSDSEHEGFIKVLDFKIKHVDVSEYVSLSTGVRVFFMYYETPLVNTYVLVPTREETDEGLPHTLEHLIFLGSEQYPFRGTLDLISCMSLSSGTNAWTSTDHTAYTLSTAGLEGTLQMLPIYLDHILRPCLTDIGFMTDIHHVTSDGSSSGVAYCEMKSRENHQDEIMFFEVLDKLYPGDSGYKRNTGGKLSGLRSTNIHRVREFHKKFYKWNNISIVVCGNVTDYKAVLSLVHDQEMVIKNPKQDQTAPRATKKKKRNDNLDLETATRNRVRVWDDPKHVRKLSKSTLSTLYFPCEEEESGSFSMSWRGPVWDDFELIRSVSFMGSYLVDSTTSPLEKALIHTSDPFGSCVDFSIEMFKESYFQLVIKDVPIHSNQNVGNRNKHDHPTEGKSDNESDDDSEAENDSEDETESEKENANVNPEFPDKMAVVEERLKSVLLSVYEKDLDMERMRMLIRRGHYNYLRQIETCAHETLIDNLIGYVIYGTRPEQLKDLMVDHDMVQRLLERDEKYWKDILYEYYIKPHSVSVKCIPSAQKSKEIQEDEKNLMESQLKKYGAEQLLKNKTMVEEDLLKNKDGPPKHILNQFKQSNSKSIRLQTYPLYRNFKFDLKEAGNPNPSGSDEKKELDDFGMNDEDKRKRKRDLERFRSELDQLSYPIQVNNIPTDFVRIYLVFSTCKLELTAEEKKLFFLLCVLLFESNVYFGDKLMGSEEFIATLMDNTTSYGCNLGLASSALLPDAYSDMFTLYLTCPVDNYDKVLDIFYNVLYNVKYDHSILTKHAKSLLNSFSKKKRSAKTLLKQLNNYLRTDTKSVLHLCSLGQQDALLKAAMADPNGPSDLEDRLRKLHSKVFRVENMSVHLTADLSKLNDNWVKFWLNLDSKHKSEHKLKSEHTNHVLHEYFGFKYGKGFKLKESTGFLSSLASTDVSYLCVTIPAPYGYNHPDYFPILTSCEYLTMTEGPLYRAIRGGGYAYHHRVSYSPSQGEIHLVISEATDLINALRVTSESILKCADPNVDIDQEILAAKSSLIYRILSNEESLADYSQETYTNAIRQTDVDFNKYSAVQIQELDNRRIREVFSKYFKNFLDFSGPPKTLACIASKTEAKNISNGFETVNYCNVQWLDSKSLLSLLSNSAEAQEA